MSSRHELARALTRIGNDAARARGIERRVDDAPAESRPGEQGRTVEIMIALLQGVGAVLETKGRDDLERSIGTLYRVGFGAVGREYQREKRLRKK